MNPSARTRFARFYRSRPLVGGALIVISGIEIFLSTQLDLGRIHVQVGIEGFQGLIIPIALVALGALVIADPGHRIFYGVITLAIAIYALAGVNLGGFMVGSILGITGAVVALSWMRPRASDADSDDGDTEDAPSKAALAPADADGAGDDLDTDLAVLLNRDDEAPAEPRPFADRPADTGRTRRRGVRTLALAGAVAIGGAGLVAVAPAQPAHAESGFCSSFLGFLCPPEGTPSPAPSASPSATSAAPASPGAPSAPAPADPGAAAPQPTPTPTLPPGVPPSAGALIAPQTADPNVAIDSSAPIVATESATLTASYLQQTNGRYVETVLLRRPDGTTVPALKILGDAGLLKDVRLHGSGAHHGAGIDASQLDVAGPIHFYAASFSGKAFGILPLHWDISSPPPVDFPMPPFTDVTVELVYFDAGAQTLTASHITPQ
ncbi:DUF6114 domain-containing protein [Microbacterium sp. ASV49]|uniref:DUF6114 domain-containing protein n=1 Tax=Microbacterium candidum TaxID=3041922 RepID=A0ABT7MZQ0_9MICO|nr:DUF6114 domain-containing protein [Microbacterium sp. ASV49]MDL9979932.1 DUF6114 domain-containing protein [Microbacterium sp. ASV49]